ncbi:MAG: guanylate kinase [Verrucomicrobiota bacterium]
MKKPNNLLVVISAPSGAGKTTLCQSVLAADSKMTRAITCTTRAPRDGEKDGVDYYFLEAETFLKKVQAGKFLEHATVYGNSYGTLKSEVLEKLRSGHDVLLNVDVQGAETIRAQAGQDGELKRALVTVFLTPPSLAELERRLRKRGSESDASLKRRLSEARKELSHWEHFDYLIISQTVAEDLRRMQVILEAERMRQYRSQAPEY